MFIAFYATNQLFGDSGSYLYGKPATRPTREFHGLIAKQVFMKRTSFLLKKNLLLWQASNSREFHGV